MIRHRLLWAVLACALLANPIAALAQEGTPDTPPSPPTQPATGPGGAEYNYDSVTANHYGPPPDASVDATGYWLFEPAGSVVETTEAVPEPLIIFFHGYFGTDPIHYREWIDHLVRRGAVVLYPDYQPLPDGLATLCPSVCLEDQLPTLPNALTAIRSGLDELAAGGHVPVDLTRVGVTGHSWGGMLSAKYASIAADEGLPVPAAVMPVMPGCECGFATEVGTIPSSSRVIVLTGRDDTVVFERFARQMWEVMTDVPFDQRDYIRLTSDKYGSPQLLADHGTSATDGDWGPLNAYDWYGTWKWFDGLLSCSFYGTDCEYALGDTPGQRFMGLWSDGTPVLEAQVSDDPFNM